MSRPLALHIDNIEFERVDDTEAFERLEKGWHNDNRPFVAAIDFDNTLQVGGLVLPGARAALTALKEAGWFIIINTCRSDSVYVKELLLLNSVPYDLVNEQTPGSAGVSKTKILADVYVDDRGIRFNGDWDTTLREIMLFRPWNKEGLQKALATAFALPDIPSKPHPVKPPIKRKRIKAKTHKVGKAGRKIYDYDDQGTEVGPRPRDLKRRFNKGEMSLYDIAQKHKVPMGWLKKQHDKGAKVEREHTDQPIEAQAIALDHVAERPDYYDRLDDMEKLPVVKPKKPHPRKPPALKKGVSGGPKRHVPDVPTIEAFKEAIGASDEVLASIVKHATPDQWVQYWQNYKPEVCKEHGMNAQTLIKVYEQITQEQEP